MEGCSAFRRGADAFLGSKVPHSAHHVFVGHGQCCAAALAHGPEDEKVPDGLRHAQPVGYCARVLPRLGPFGAGLERPNDRGAVLCLY